MGKWIDVVTSLAMLAIGGAGTVFWFFYRRDIRRSDEAARDRQRTLDAHGDKLDSHARQIRDTRAAVGCCETALKIEHYPYTD
jgi:hypothetical protein